MEAIFILSLLLALLILRIPVYLALYLGGLIGFLIFTDLDLTFVAQTFLVKLQNFSLISIPFFILLGNIMVRGDSATRLVELAMALVHRLPAGLPITGVCASAVFGAISGSSVSTLMTIGSVLLPNLERHNYPKELGIGLLVNSAILGMIIPPSIIMIVCALTAGESVIRLFASGYLPGIIIVFALSSYALIVFNKKKHGILAKDDSSFTIWQNAIKALPPIFLVVFLFWGIYSGAFTITEASVMSCVFAIITEAFIYRTLTIKSFATTLRDSFMVSGALVITICGAGVVSEYITIRQIPEQILAFSMQYIPNKHVFLLFCNILLLIVGTFMDPIGAIMILVPIIVPIASQLGIDQTHMCLIITVALGIGYVTPPLGLLLYAATAISKKPFTYIVKASLPSMLVMIITLFILSYVPFFSTIIPDLLLGPRK